MWHRSTVSLMKPVTAAICLLAASTVAHGQTWNLGISGDWNTATNWTSPVAVPDAPDAVAVFGNIFPANPATITLSASATIGTLTASTPAPNFITIDDTTNETLSFDVTSGNAMVNVTAGRLTFANQIIALDPITFTVTTAEANGLTVGAVDNMTSDLTIAGTGTTTLGGVIMGTGGLIMSGSGTTTVSGTNTYTGTTTVNSGNLVLNGGNAIANGAPVVLADVAGANLMLGANEEIGSLNGGGTTGGTVSLGTFTLTTGSADTTDNFGGVISGTGGLTKLGTGTMTLSGANTYTGNTNITAGTLSVTGGSAIADTSDVSVSAGATLDVAASETIATLAGAGNVTLNANTLFVGEANVATTTDFSGVISGTGGLTKFETSTLRLLGANTYTGTTTVNGGVLDLVNINAIDDDGAVALADANGAILMLSANETIGSLSGGGTTGGNVMLGANTLTTGDNDTSTTYGGVISGTGALTKIGTGTFTLSGNNTYSGLTSIMNGTMLATNNNALGESGGASTTVVSMGAELQLSGGITVSANETLQISGTGTTTNGALFNLAGTNTLNGGINLLPATPATIGTVASTTLNIAGNINNVTSDLTFNNLSGVGGGGQTNVTGVISGTGQVILSGAGATTLAGTNTYTGATTINAGNAAIVTNSMGLGTTGAGTNVVSGGTLALSTAIGSAVAEPLTISGTGITTGIGVVPMNPGALSNVQGNANTYSGAITLNGDATITNLFQPGLLTITGGINNGGNTLTFDGAGNTTVNTTGITTGITGTGGLTKNGAGTLTMGASNNYNGTTTINNGTISIGAVDGLGAAGTGITFGGGTLSLTNNLTLTDAVSLTGTGTIDTAAAGTSNFSGVFSGAGGLIKIGAGTQSLDAAPTYSGVTTVTAGTLQFTADTSGLGGNMTNNAAVIFNQAANSSFANVISGNGTVTKTGAGTLTLSGASTYTGATTVNGGRLDVNGSLASATTVNTGATLGGTGTITGNVTAANGSTIAPGNSIGVLNVTGTFNQNTGSTFQLEVAPVAPGSEVAGTTHDQVNVTGNAVIQSGTTVQVLPAAGNYALGNTFTFVNTTTGVSGAYSTLNGAVFNNGLLLGSLVTNANNVQLVINQSNFAGSGVTPNQAATGAGIDMATPIVTATPGSDGVQVITGLSSLSGATLQSALEQIGAASHGSVRNLKLSQSFAYTQAVANRIRDLTTRTGIIGGTGVIRGQSPSTTDSYYVSDGYYDYSDDPYYGTGIDLSGWTAWFQGYGGYGELESNFQAQGLDYRGGGAVAGAHRLVDGDTYQGMMIGYNNTTADVNNNRNSTNVNTYQIGLYQSQMLNDDWYMLGLASYGYGEYESARRIMVPGLNRIANGDFDGHQLDSYLEVGTNANIMNWEVQPYVGLQYILIGQNSYSETGAGFLNLAVAEQQSDSLRQILGLRMSRSLYGASGRQYAPQFHARYMHEYLQDNTGVAATFAGTTAAFTTQGINLPRDLFVVGFGGTALSLNRDTSLYLGYDVMFGSSQIEHSGNASFQYEW